ncbi:putative ribonuclease H-like domain-containing protein [Tanacetum coccineum]|uniref:Ribonuclease H-like domain-containing protein n=1 Tax=Tanacetum coccineum TaxID=301880 RepID=A0ABQ4WF03_9ASTR
MDNHRYRYQMCSADTVIEHLWSSCKKILIFGDTGSYSSYLCACSSSGSDTEALKPINAARKANIVKPIVNNARPKAGFHKSVSPFRKSFNRTTALRTNFSKQNVNTAKKGNLVRGLPSKIFHNDHTCVACQKGKQHKASCLVGCDNGTEFKNRDFIELCGSKGIKREYSNARTPQQNGVAERKNMTLIEAARTMLADSFLPNTFWAEAVSTLLDSLQEANQNAGTKENIDAGDSPIEVESAQDYFVLPIWSSYTSTVKSSKASEEPTKHPDFQQVDKEDQVFWMSLKDLKYKNMMQMMQLKFSRRSLLKKLRICFYKQELLKLAANPTDGSFTNSSYDDEGVVAEFTNLEPVMNVSPIPSSRFNSIHPSSLILRDPQSAVQTRSKVTKKISEALEDESWVDAIQEELFQFKIQRVWILVDLPYGKKVIGTKWVYRNKKDERGVVVRNKARLVAQGHRQEQGIDYDEVFAPVARIEAIRIFLAFASYMRFIVYQIDVKSTFLYGKIDVEVYVSQPLSFIDPKYPKKVYKVVKSLYGLHQAPRACVKTASTPIETQKPLVKDEEASDVDVHLYRSMIGYLMYLTASRPDIMFAVCACSRVSLFDLEAYSDSDYARANLDRKSTTGEAEYVAAANCCGQVLWIQNQMLDYGFNFMNTKIYIDNESTICIVKNPVYHYKTKHIAIRHHFIRDAYEKKLI